MLLLFSKCQSISLYHILNCASVLLATRFNIELVCANWCIFQAGRLRLKICFVRLGWRARGKATKGVFASLRSPPLIFVYKEHLIQSVAGFAIVRLSQPCPLASAQNHSQDSLTIVRETYFIKQHLYHCLLHSQS